MVQESSRKKFNNMKQLGYTMHRTSGSFDSNKNDERNVHSITIHYSNGEIKIIVDDRL